MPQLQQADPHPAPAAPGPRGRAGYAPSRRRLLKSGLGARIGLGAAGLLGACSATTCADAAASAGASSGPWSFTDDRGTVLKLGAAPTRVVPYSGTAAALHDFGVSADQFAAVFGPTKPADGKADPMAGSLPVDRLTVLGETYGEFDVAEYAKLDPQVLIAHTWEKGALWYVPDASASTIAKLAPNIGIAVAGTPLTHPLAQYEKLAGLLGADLVRPDNVQGGFFKSLSWENAGKYAADLILLDDRTTALQPEDLAGKPTWTGLPAVKTGQILGWAGELRYSYSSLGPVVAGFATALRNAKKVA